MLWQPFAHGFPDLFAILRRSWLPGIVTTIPNFILFAISCSIPVGIATHGPFAVFFLGSFSASFIGAY